MSDQLQSQGPRSGGFLHFLHYKASKDWCVSNRSAPARHESVSLRLLLVGYSSFSGGQHVVEGVFANTCLDWFYPLLLLLWGWCWNSIHNMVAFDHAPISFSLAGFDNLAFVAGVEELKAVRLSWIFNFPDAEILQRNYSSRFFVRCVFKVIEAIICENEPSALPCFHSSP